MELVHSKSAKELVQVAADTLSRELMVKADRTTLLLISGGSSLKVLDSMNDASVRSNIQIAQVDERWTTNEKELNSALFKKTKFAKRLAERGVPFVPMDTISGGTVEESAKRYEEYLKRWRGAFQNGVVIGLFGIGTDGHIAGVMPFPEEKTLFEETFLNTRRWTVGYETGGRGNFPIRMTLTLHYLLQEIDASVVYACGEEKRGAIQKILSPDGTLAETPARVLNEMRGVHLFTDTQ